LRTETFKKSFILKGFSEDYVHYLPKKAEENDLKPMKQRIVKSVELGPVLYPAIKRQLLAV